MTRLHRLDRACVAATVVALTMTACSEPVPSASLNELKTAQSEGLCVGQYPGGNTVELRHLDGSRVEHRMPMPPNDELQLLPAGRISPDGEYVIASDWFHDRSSVVSVGMDGRERWRVPLAGGASTASFSDDETKIALSIGDRLFVLDVPSRTLTDLGVKGGRPAWPFRGTDRLAYDDDANVYVYDFGRREGRLVGRGTAPSWTPDEKSLAVNQDFDTIVLVNVETGARRAFMKRSVITTPRWSPDGQWILYTYSGGGTWRDIEPHQIMIRQAATGRETSIGAFSKGNSGDYTWVRNRALCGAGAAPSSSQKPAA